eukprot:6212419-Pleurochrysis_carterae.AAC.2
MAAAAAEASDVRKQRPLHAGRSDTRDRLESAKRVSKRSISERWDKYRKLRAPHGLSIIGSRELFKKIWAAHTEIRGYSAKTHPECDDCGKLESELDALGLRTNAEAVAARAKIVSASVRILHAFHLFAHAKFHDAITVSVVYMPTLASVLRALTAYSVHEREHRKERQYFNHAWYCGETYPSRLTWVNIDAPTQHQFDLSCQRRVGRDVVTTLDGKHKWQSKMTGAMVSGVGFMAYVACASAVGGGPNLVLTALLLVFEKTAQTNGQLGSRLHVELDNTCGENKNKTVIAFLAWLVYADIFQEAGFFRMMKGHTFTILDQSFGTPIKAMKKHAVYTILRMLQLIACARLLLVYPCQYNVVDCRKLHCLWGFKSWL